MRGRRAEGRVGFAGGRDFARGLLGVVVVAEGFTNGGIRVIEIRQQFGLRLSGRAGGTIRLDGDGDSSTTVLIVELINNDTVRATRQQSEFGARDEAQIQGNRVNQDRVRDGVWCNSQVEHEGCGCGVDGQSGTGTIGIAFTAGGTRCSRAFAGHTDIAVALGTRTAVSVFCTGGDTKTALTGFVFSDTAGGRLIGHCACNRAQIGSLIALGGITGTTTRSHTDTVDTAFRGTTQSGIDCAGNSHIDTGTTESITDTIDTRHSRTAGHTGIVDTGFSFIATDSHTGRIDAGTAFTNAVRRTSRIARAVMDAETSREIAGIARTGTSVERITRTRTQIGRLITVGDCAFTIAGRNDFAFTGVGIALR